MNSCQYFICESIVVYAAVPPAGACLSDWICMEVKMANKRNAGGDNSKQVPKFTEKRYDIDKETIQWCVRNTKG